MKNGQLVRLHKTSGVKRLYVQNENREVVGAVMVTLNTVGIVLEEENRYSRILTDRGVGWVETRSLVLI